MITHTDMPLIRSNKVVKSKELYFTTLLALYFLALFTNCYAGLNVWTQGLGTDSEVVESLCIDPVQPNRVYASGLWAVLRSYDYGSTWSLATAPYDQGVVPQVNPASNNMIYGAGNVFFDISTDYGVTWQNRSTIEGDIYTLFIDPQDSNRLYVGGSAVCDCLFPFAISTDHGYTWQGSYTGMTVASVQDIKPVPGKPGELYTAAGTDTNLSYGVYFSSDSGITWSAKTVGLGLADYFSVCVHPTNTNIVYTGSREGDLYYSDNSGDSWSLITTFGGNIIWSIIVHPYQPNIMYLANEGGGVFKSEDTGFTWTPFNNGLSDLRVYGLVFDPINRILYAGFDSQNDTPASGIWTYTDGTVDIEDWMKYY